MARVDDWWAWSDKVKEPPKSEGAAKWQARKKREARQAARRLLPQIRKAAKAMGYAIGLHGSVSRDIDLIAVPWSETANHWSGQELAEVICWICKAETGWGFFSPADANPTIKPHGRLAWSIHLWGTYFDLSVMPTEGGQPCPVTTGL